MRWRTRRHWVAHTHTHTHSHTHTHTHTLTHTHSHRHTYTSCVHTYMHTYVRTCIHTCIHTYVHAYIHTYIRTYMHTYMHTCVHTYIHPTHTLPDTCKHVDIASSHCCTSLSHSLSPQHSTLTLSPPPLSLSLSLSPSLSLSSIRMCSRHRSHRTERTPPRRHPCAHAHRARPSFRAPHDSHTTQVSLCGLCGAQQSERECEWSGAAVVCRVTAPSSSRSHLLLAVTV